VTVPINLPLFAGASRDFQGHFYEVFRRRQPGMLASIAIRQIPVRKVKIFGGG